MESLTVAELKQSTNETPLQAAVEAQLQQRTEKTTRKGDPYLELTLADATSSFTLRSLRTLSAIGTGAVGLRAF